MKTLTLYWSRRLKAYRKIDRAGKPYGTPVEVTIIEWVKWMCRGYWGPPDVGVCPNSDGNGNYQAPPKSPRRRGL